MAKKPPPGAPVAEGVDVAGNSDYELLQLVFKVHSKPYFVHLHPADAISLIQQLADVMTKGPQAFQEAAGVFAIQGRLSVGLQGRVPTISYGLGVGQQLTTSIDAVDLRQLIAEATQVLEHLDSLGSSPIQ